MQIVQDHVGCEIAVSVSRPGEEAVMTLALVPRQWGGRGLLGYRLGSLTTAIPLHRPLQTAWIFFSSWNGALLDAMISQVPFRSKIELL